MKQSWIIGVVMLYMTILGLEMLATGGTVFSNPVTSNAGTILYPNLVTILINGANYLKAIIQVMFLWSPTVFSGYLLWVYWFFCFPIACAMIYGVVSLIRGV